MLKGSKNNSSAYDVIVVGAGASGVGVGVALKQAGVVSMKILEQHQIGASFLNWPEEMRFITPSFPSNPFGQIDLNSIHPDTSPAFSLGREHPRGKEYARYLTRVAQYFDLPVQEGVFVQEVIPAKRGFEVRTSTGSIRTRFVVWAAGEFFYPRIPSFPGSEYGLHSSRIHSWKSIQGDPVVVIGGFESGIDAAYHLAKAAQRVMVIDPAAPWEGGTEVDPSLTLSPFTRARLRRLNAKNAIGNNDQVQFFAESVLQIDQEEDAYRVKTVNRTIRTPIQPILATGFTGSLILIHDLFEWDREGGFPVLSSEADESTRTSGLFVCGPLVRHRSSKGVAILCFIYKYRSRFALIAAAIAKRLGYDPSSMLALYGKANMILKDLVSCCSASCAC